jgi:hypothetical protein
MPGPGLTPPRNEKLDNLTIVRFFAAFVVFMMHGGMVFLNDPAMPQFVKNIISHGGEGVTIFFVLSGYILAYNYKRKILESAFNFKDYLTNRFARIYPMYLVALIVGIPFMIAHARFLGVHYNPAYLLIDSICRLFLLHAWNPYFNTHPHWLTQGWTLSVELLFYLSFPFLVNFIERWKKYIWIIWSTAIVLSWLPRMLLVVKFGDASTDWVQQFPLLRLPEFITGICSYYIFEASRSKSRLLLILKYVSVLAILLILSQSYWYAKSAMTAILVLATSSLMIGQSVNHRKGGTNSVQKLFVFLGEASYSMYLIHGFFIVLVFKFMGKVLHSNAEDSYLAFAISLILTLAGAALCYLYIEVPSRIWLRSRLVRSGDPASLKS